MFLLITEDGQMYRTNNITDEDKQIANDGLLDIVNMSTHLQYYQDAWHRITRVDNVK